MHSNTQKGIAGHQNLDILATEAITAALSSRWQEAAKINEKIVSSHKNDVEALNRLALAYNCLGHSKKAEKVYKKVLEIDPFNIIAIKNLQKLAKGSGNGNGHTINSSSAFATNLSQVFFYEPGKTKLVSLLNLAPPQVLATINCGDEVLLNPKNHAITISNNQGIYLGAFPDDFAHRLLSLIATGYRYQTFVKSITTKQLSIFIRETQRAIKFAGQPSFMNKNNSVFDEESS